MYITRDITLAASRQSPVTVTCDGRTTTGHILAFDSDFVTLLDHDTNLHRTVERARVSRWFFDWSYN